MGANFNFNKVIIGGRLTTTPELRSTSAGTLCTNFHVAVNRRTKNGTETDFIPCTDWGDRADFVTKWFHKGSSICVTGTLRNRKWTDVNGNERTLTEVSVDDVTFVDSKDETTAPATASSATPAPKFEDVNPEDENLPF